MSSNIKNSKDVSKDLLSSLKADSKQSSTFTADKLYSTQIVKGSDLISENDFKNMNLKQDLVNGLYSMSIEKPTNVQNLAIPAILSKKDHVFHSKSGTGKTIAFATCAIDRAVANKTPQVIILTPTRELNSQVGKVVSELAEFCSLRVCIALGNLVADTVTEEIIVGCPRKVCTLIEKNHVDPTKVKMVILDEADNLITTPAHQAQVLRLLKKLTDVQKIFFSATYSELSRKTIEAVAPGATAMYDKNHKADNISLYNMEIDKDKKISAVKELFDYLPIAQCIIFVSSKIMADKLKKELVIDNYTVSCIHGGMEFSDRDKVANEFLNAKTKILVATDVFSRGMDIPQVNLIINFDLPSDFGDGIENSYIHRIGRSGRFGRVGFVIDFIACPEDFKKLAEIQTYLEDISQAFTLESLKEAFAEDDTE